MLVKALEISINGKRLYTVGAADWRSLTAHVWGHRFPADYFNKDNWPEDEPLPDKDIEQINFRASVAVPDNMSPGNEVDPSRQGDWYLTESYKDRPLKVGDVVTVKVIETDELDEPDGPKPDPRFPGPTVMPSISDSG